jgi:hypothetical protein
MQTINDLLDILNSKALICYGLKKPICGTRWRNGGSYDRVTKVFSESAALLSSLELTNGKKLINSNRRMCILGLCTTISSIQGLCGELTSDGGVCAALMSYVPTFNLSFLSRSHRAFFWRNQETRRMVQQPYAAAFSICLQVSIA